MGEGTDVLSLKNQKRGHHDRRISARKRAQLRERRKLKLVEKVKIKYRK